MEVEDRERKKAVAIFMAFGTQGDVYPIAAIGAAFSCDQKEYSVTLVTHSAHENLRSHLKEANMSFHPINSPPALLIPEDCELAGSQESFFELRKKIIASEQRKECLLAVEEILGDGPSVEGDFIVINFFALEGWSLAELFHIRCVVAAPYVVPYSAPSSFERHFVREHPMLYKCLHNASSGKVCWKDVMHWMWPLFTEHWGLWRHDDLKLSTCPFTDPVTGLPNSHDWPQSPLLLYGFSHEIVECPDYWPSNIHVCGFWFLPIEWQFSCRSCGEITALDCRQEMEIRSEHRCSHTKLQCFLESSDSAPPIFMGLSSVGSMGFLKNPQAFLQVIERVLEITDYKFVLFTAGYKPLVQAIQIIATDQVYPEQRCCTEEDVCLFDGRLFCFSGMMPYKWLFPRCAAAIHHGGSGSTAAALYAGIPQVVCPFILDQFYWAEKMHWLGVAPEPLKRNHLVPDESDDTSIGIAGKVLSQSIAYALSPRVMARALEIAEMISKEDGVTEALKILKQEMGLK